MAGNGAMTQMVGQPGGGGGGGGRGQAPPRGGGGGGRGGGGGYQDDARGGGGGGSGGVPPIREDYEGSGELAGVREEAGRGSERHAAPQAMSQTDFARQPRQKRQIEEEEDEFSDADLDDLLVD